MKINGFALIVVTASLLAHTVSADESSVDFGSKVQPILSDKCYFCHGPDSENRQADLRLDSADEARDVLDSGEVARRIRSDDPDEQMPPPKAKLALTEDEKELLETWIEQGAEYRGHWAFEPLPTEVELPTVAFTDWIRQPLDQFVLHTIEQNQRTPSAEATPVRWLRRVSLDLTGIPPSIGQLDEFMAEIGNAGSDRAAIERVYAATAERLLNSNGFGEHMAVAWLDAARYADSYGYQSDKLNTQWPYRDWVVRAFNEGLPYDQFLTWQLAGDLLEDPTPDQQLATAFNRIHRLNNEGGAVFEEWRLENVADRVHTFGTAMLGLTLECCRCHDHKYDPIPTRDYYSLSAFFNSIDESGVYDRTEKVPAPSMLLPTATEADAIERAKTNLRLAETDYDNAITAAKSEYNRWRSDQLTANRPTVVSDLTLAICFDEPYSDKLKSTYHPSLDDRGWTAPLATMPVADSPLPRLMPQQCADTTAGDNQDDAPLDSVERRAIRLDGERGITTHGIEPFDRWTPFSVVVSLRETKRVPLRAVIAHHTRGTDCGYNGWDLTIEDGHLESRLYRVWPGNAIGVRTTAVIPSNRWHQVAAVYDGSSTAAGLTLYLNGQRLETEILRDEIKKSANVKVDHGGEFVLGQRFRSRGLDGGLIDDLRIYARNLSAGELTHLATGKPIEPTLDYYVSAVNESTRKAFQGLRAARHAYVVAEEVPIEVPIMVETDQPRETHVLARGQYDAPTSDATRVERRTFAAVLPSFPAEFPRNRLGLAQWMTLPNHPLTARVFVNRVWSSFFGQGLVRTPENFGLQGEPPTHPQLLDWLARDFVDHDWNIKRLCKIVVLSATYRQTSATTAADLAADPDNRWLARGPAHRLSAEQIRDLALEAAGLLNRTTGGPPVSPYQAGGDLWKESNQMSPAYEQSVGKDLYRRSLYSVWKRTAPLPNMMAFDMESREVCTVKRSRTNTPLQALVLMNDVQFVEASRKLAEQAIASHPAPTQQIEFAFKTLTSRLPSDFENERLRGLHNDELMYYRDHADEAAKLIGLGENPPDSQIDNASLAALTTVCQTILNLDATIWKR